MECFLLPGSMFLVIAVEAEGKMMAAREELSSLAREHLVRRLQEPSLGKAHET